MQACPKCQYVRKPEDKNPEWQCPRCEIVYAKFEASAQGGSTSFNTNSRPVSGKDTGNEHSSSVLGYAVKGAISVVGAAAAFHAHRSGTVALLWVGGVLAVIPWLWRLVVDDSGDGYFWSGDWSSSSDSSGSDGDSGGGDGGGGGD